MRSFGWLGMSLMLIVWLLASAPVALAQGNSEAAKLCEEGGYLNWTDADGTPFANVGECARYVAQGGTLVPIKVVDPDLFIVEGLFGSSVHGTGFTPNTAIVVLTATITPGGYTYGLPLPLYPTNEDGAFNTVSFLDFCMDFSQSGVVPTAVEISAADAAGVTHTETFALECGVA